MMAFIHRLALSLALVFLVAGFADGQSGALGKARALAGKAEYDAALAELDGFLAANPGHVEARLYRGVIFARRGDADRAIVVFRRLAGDHPELPEPQNNLAVVFASVERYDEAREALLKAVAIQPGYDTAHENLGDIYTELARLSYGRAFELNRNNTRARDKSVALEALTDVPGGEAEKAAEPETAAPDNVAEQGGETVPPAEPQREFRPETARPSCYSIGPFYAASETKSVLDWLQEQGMDSEARERDEPQVLNYLVFMPPLAGRTAAEATVKQMRSAGIRDVLPISRGEHINGVALGVFSTRDRAERRVAEVKAKGFEARYRGRAASRKVYWIEIHPDRQPLPDEEAFAARFSGRSLTPVSCGQDH